jgi:hypothetical protein
VRLLHAASRKWLRASDAFESPLTANYEVSLAGGDGGGDDGMSSDGGDVWIVDWAATSLTAAQQKQQQKQQQQQQQDKGSNEDDDYWRQDARVSLQHAATGGYLTALRHAEFGRPVPGSPPSASRSREVCALSALGADGWWIAAEGVYLPVRRAAFGGGVGSSGGGVGGEGEARAGNGTSGSKNRTREEL